ncbi:MAG: GH116 family glycosyl-hydrolase [Chloroflexota bacterium]
MEHTYNPPRNESGVPLGGIGAGKVEFCKDGRFTNVTTNNNWDCPIYNDTAAFPLLPRIREGAPGSVDENAERRQSMTSYEGVPGAWLAVYNPVDGAHSLKTHNRPAITGITQEQIDYRGRFPIAAVQYSGFQAMRLSLKAYSSFMLGDTSDHYHDSSLPLALIAFELENTHSHPYKASLAMSWQNLNGVGGYAGFPINDPDPTPPVFRTDPAGAGLWFGHAPDTHLDPRVTGDFSLRAACSHPTAQVSYCAGWEARGHGDDVWQTFASTGQFDNRSLPYTAGALAIQVELQPGEKTQVVFTLGWNMPHLLAAETQWEYLVRPSGAAPAPKSRNRRDYGHAYSRWYADSWQAAGYGLQHWEDILHRIEAWQAGLDVSLPPRLVEALCNDLFPLYAAAWYTYDYLCAMNEAPTDMNGCMGTLDQRGVGHAATVLLFPELNKAELGMFARDQVGDESDPRNRSIHYDMHTGRFNFPLNMEGAILHDVGWDHLEAGRMGDQVWLCSHWPELTSLFVLQCYQHAVWTGDTAWLDARYPQMKKALQFQSRMDQDGDGIAELWGVGSNTYDTELYPYYGATPYIATLYMAALKAAQRVADQKGDVEFSTWAAARCQQACATLEGDLWDEELGYYYGWLDRLHHAWDSLPEQHGRVGNHSHISQLAGEFWANLLDLGGLVDPARRLRTIESIGERNVRQVPGVPADEFRPDGSHSQAMSAFVLGYYGGLSTAAGRPNLGWEAVEKVYHVRYDIDGCPWDATLQWSGPGNTQAQWGRWYFSTPASWYYYWSLAGAHYDRLGQNLWLNPSWPAVWGDTLKALPVYLPAFQAELTAQRGPQSWTVNLTFRRLLNTEAPVRQFSLSLPEHLLGRKLKVTCTGLLAGNVPAEHSGRLWWEVDLRPAAGDGFSVTVTLDD